MDCFRKDQQGAILPVFGVMVILLVVIGGAAIDVTRAVNAREKLSYALDDAALAVSVALSSRLMSDEDAKKEVVAHLTANLPNEGWAQTAIKNVTLKIDDDNGTVDIDTSSSLDNYFINIGGYGQKALGPDTFTFGTSAQVSYSRFNVDIVMALDTTGSMGGSIGALKKSARDFIGILLQDNTTSSAAKVRVGMVPYSDSVNPDNIPKIHPNNAQGNVPRDGSRCIGERFPWFADDEFSINSWGYSWYYQSGERWTWNNDPPVNRRDFACTAPMVPLTANKDKLESSIRQITAWGGTAGQVGVEFAWRLMSPFWRNVLPTESAPLDYPQKNDRKNKKIAVLMTDGEFNQSYSLTRKNDVTCMYPDYQDQHCNKQGNYVWTSQYFSPVPNMDALAVSRAVKFCDIMKARNIEIYTIFFETPNQASPYGRKVMEVCASGPDNFKHAGDDKELRTAFGNIANQIQKIHLSR